MQLSARALNRTLLLRQHLLVRSTASAHDLVSQLVGLQAQDVLPPYLSLAARIEDFDPRDLSDRLESRECVRLLTLRGTIHVLTEEDALALRPWVQPMLDRSAARAADGTAAIPVDALAAGVSHLLRDGPVAVPTLGRGLADRHPGVPAAALSNAARARLPLVQVPPRGLWAQSGGVVYERVETWLGQPLSMPDTPELVRRYLRAFGPATAADLTAWSGVTGLGPVIKAMPDLVEHTGPDGSRLLDVPDAPVADEDTPAPVRLLGKYDNLWLAHSARDRVTPPESRKRWMGPNGGRGNTIFVNGVLAGLWQLQDGRIQTELFTTVSTQERRQLRDEVRRTEELLEHR